MSLNVLLIATGVVWGAGQGTDTTGYRRAQVRAPVVVSHGLPRTITEGTSVGTFLKVSAGRFLPRADTRVYGSKARFAVRDTGLVRASRMRDTTRVRVSRHRLFDREGTRGRTPDDVRLRFDTFFSEPSEPDESVVSVAPVGWWHDAADAVVGVRWRSNYMGRFNRWTLELHRGIGGFQPTTQGHDILDYYVEFANPTWLRSPGWSQSIATWSQEGTVGARVELVKTTRGTPRAPSGRESGGSVRWVATEQTNFLDPRRWDNAGTIELGLFTDWNDGDGDTRWRYRVDAWGGAVYRNSDAADGGPYDWSPLARATVSLRMRQSFAGFTLGVRGFAGGVWQDGDRPVRQRGISVAGADPYQTLRNPLVRAQGAPFVGPDIFYHSPGNANMRGFRPGIDGRWALSLNLELERDIIRRTDGLFRGVGLVGFWDAASVDTVAVPAQSNNAFKTIYDAGAGLRAWFHLGDVTFPLRVEFPFYVSTPSFAHNRKRGVDQVEFRWLVSFQPTF